MADGTQMTTLGRVNRYTDTLQQQTDHALGDVEIGDGATTQGPYGDDVTRRSTDHVPRLVPGRENLAGLAIDGYDRRLVQNDATALHVDERVRRAEVDCEVAGHVRPV